MYFVGSEACRVTNRVIVGVFDVRMVCIPVFLVLVADHGQHLCHGVVYAFDTPVIARVVGACRDFVYAQEFVDGCRELCAELKSAVGQRVDGHPQRRIKRFTKMLAVPSVVNSAAVTANISARRLKRSVKSRM